MKRGLVIDEHGTKRWFKNNELHREDGPAVVYVDGHKAWFVDDKLHRIDGPAIELPSGYKEWWVDGIELTEEEFNKMKGN